MPPQRKTTSKSSNAARTLRTRDCNRKDSPIPHHADIIVISDSEDDNALATNLAQKRKRQATTTPRSLGESSSVAKLKQEIEAMRKEQALLADALSEANKRADQAEAKAKATITTLSAVDKLDLSDLEDRISCEVCTMKMWRPYTLYECGHTFCERCLHDWFNTTYTRHVDQHPEFLAGPEIPEAYTVYRNHPRYRAAIEQYTRQWELRTPKPVYTCPTCRIVVKQKPVEVFAIKDMVRSVSRLTDGEGSPKAKRPNKGIGSVFDGFFPSIS